MEMRQLLELNPQEELVQVQEEPALEIAIPQVFSQPPLVMLQRDKLPHMELLVARLYQAQAGSNGTASLGPDYQALVNEFQPLFTWATACWDYLLSTEGCRFLTRQGDERLYSRGDYRAATDRDYSRLVHRIFRMCVLAFAQTPVDQTLASYLRAHFWDAVAGAYRKLEEPGDPRQRKLTAYSYLRCVPYQFLNRYHHELVHSVLRKLPREDQRALDLYFLQFFTLDAAAHTMELSIDGTEDLLRHSLLPLLRDDRLVYCLLRQIERY